MRWNEREEETAEPLESAVYSKWTTHIGEVEKIEGKIEKRKGRRLPVQKSENRLCFWKEINTFYSAKTY